MISDNDAADAIEKPDLSELDSFDPSRFARVPEAEMPSVRKMLTTCRVGNPPKDAFVRASTDPRLSLDVDLLKTESDGEIYLLTPEVAQALPDSMVKAQNLTVSRTRHGDTFLWAITPIPTTGKDNSWWRSARLAQATARRQWVRVQSNTAAKGYDVFSAAVDIPEPEWPEYTMAEYLRVAFAGNTITDPDDSIILAILGKA